MPARSAAQPASALERASYGKAWQVWRERAETVPAAVTAFTTAHERGRCYAEMDVKKTARHPAPGEEQQTVSA